jgi:hypothetical protein
VRRAAYGYRTGKREYRMVVNTMASARQVQAAKRNIRKAQQAARGRQRAAQAGAALEDRNRQQFYETAKDKNISGRSKMGKWDLIKAIRKAA